MKIRNGFVSNSSSSSFVCNLCSNVESGYDMCMSEAGFVECESCGDVCCYDEIEDIDKDKLKTILSRKFDGDKGVDMQEVNKLIDDGNYGSIYDEYDLRYDYPKELCHRCQKLESYAEDDEFKEYERLKDKFNGI